MDESIDIQNESVSIKPRRSWLAGLLSLVATGMGQVYNGQWKKGIGLYLTELVMTVIMVPFWTDFAAMLLCMSILLGFNVFVVGEAFAVARKLRGYTLRPCNRWWVYGMCLLVSGFSGWGLFSVIETHCFMAYEAPSGSMLPTIRVGDHFMVELLSGDDAVGRGCIVIFASSKTGGKDFVKRIVGLPSETVELRDKVVFIDGHPLEEPYVWHSRPEMLFQRDNFGPTLLGADEFFVLGDNREDSYDSRWLGPVKRAAIKGRARYIYFPAEVGASGWSERLGLEFN